MMMVVAREPSAVVVASAARSEVQVDVDLDTTMPWRLDTSPGNGSKLRSGSCVRVVGSDTGTREFG